MSHERSDTGAFPGEDEIGQPRQHLDESPARRLRIAINGKFVDNPATLPIVQPDRPNRARPTPLRGVAEFGVALVNVAATLVSLILGCVFVVVALATRAHAQLSTSAIYVVGLSLFAFGMPAALALWRHGRDYARALVTMSWLIAVWNASVLWVGTIVMPVWLSGGLADADRIVAQFVGETHPATRLALSAGQEAAAQLQGETPEVPAALTVHEVGRDMSRATKIALGEDGSGIFVDVVLHGPGGDVNGRYLFDTGASYTTITSEMAKKLGVQVPDDAPSLEFSTAAGARSSKMVYLPELRIGEVTIPGILVSICDTCATERYPGLLGINVLREFYIEMDYQHERMELIPRKYDGVANRAYDIQPMVSLSIDGRAELWMRHVRWTATVKNRSNVTLRNVIPKVEFNNGHVVHGVLIPEIAPGASAKSLIRGKAATVAQQQVEFTLKLAQAQW